MYVANKESWKKLNVINVTHDVLQLWFYDKVKELQNEWSETEIKYSRVA